MSRRFKAALLITLAGALAIVVGAVIVSAPTTAGLPGTMITRTDFTGGGISVGTSLVGDTVMFVGAVPSVAQNHSIKIVDIAVSKATPGMRLADARVYETRYFEGATVIGWQTRNGEENDPRRQPNNPLIGQTFTGEATSERFVLYEFTVCNTGDLSVDSIDLIYTEESDTYTQTLLVNFDVKDVALSNGRCPN